MKKYIILLAIASFIFNACQTTNKYYPTADFKKEAAPTAPDYAKMDNWASHPDKDDPADRVPKEELASEQMNAKADVFFVYPTIYTGTEEDQTTWNASINDEELNEDIDNGTIMFQTSAFNGAGKIYAPRYRQAHINVYYKTATKENAKAALDLAYEDVKRAFEYYLKNYNDGRPIIIASHSQGTTHTERLLKDYFDGKDLQKQLVAAYLVGMAIEDDTYESIPVCETPTQTGCFCTWNTYKKGHYPKSWEKSYKNAVVTNPIIWETDETYADYDENIGALIQGFKLKPNFSDAQVKDGMLWIGTPKLFGAFLLNRKRWHFADYNLFYMNVRKNAKDRVAAFLKARS